jgi:hypothetical protein
MIDGIGGRCIFQSSSDQACLLLAGWSGDMAVLPGRYRHGLSRCSSNYRMRTRSREDAAERREQVGTFRPLACRRTASFAANRRPRVLDCKACAPGGDLGKTSLPAATTTTAARASVASTHRQLQITRWACSLSRGTRKAVRNGHGKFSITKPVINIVSRCIASTYSWKRASPTPFDIIIAGKSKVQKQPCPAPLPECQSVAGWSSRPKPAAATNRARLEALPRKWARNA